MKASAAAQLLKPEDLARAQSGYAKRRNNAAETTNSQTGGAGAGVGGPQDDKISILTMDRLRKFNDINGYEHGPAANAEQEGAQQQQPELDYEEAKDLVNDLIASPSKGGKAGRNM